MSEGACAQANAVNPPTNAHPLPSLLLSLSLLSSPLLPVRCPCRSDDEDDYDEGEGAGAEKDGESKEEGKPGRPSGIGLIGEHKPAETVPVLVDKRSDGAVLQLSVLMGPVGRNISALRRDRVKRGRQNRTCVWGRARSLARSLARLLTGRAQPRRRWTRRLRTCVRETTRAISTKRTRPCLPKEAT